jgi:hypothetical protein
MVASQHAFDDDPGAAQAQLSILLTGSTDATTPA